jgi:hydrogenase 3 maturation protease
MTGDLLSLIELLREPTCLVGVGNPLRRDDGVGPWIAGAVRDAASGTRLSVVDAQDVPENFAPAIARTDCRNVVFVDAVAAEGPPGSVVFGPLSGFGEVESFSTHRLALSLEFGEGLTAEVERAAATLRDLILRAVTPSY